MSIDLTTGCTRDERGHNFNCHKICQWCNRPKDEIELEKLRNLLRWRKIGNEFPEESGAYCVMSDLEWKQYPDEKPADSDINKLFLIRCFLGKEGSWSRCTDIRSYWPSDWNRYPNGYVTAYQWIGPIPETQYHPLPGEGGE